MTTQRWQTLSLTCSADSSEGAESMNKQFNPLLLQTITYLQEKLFACGFTQICKQTFSQDISTLIVRGHILHGHILETNKMVMPGSTHRRMSCPRLTCSKCSKVAQQQHCYSKLHMRVSLGSSHSTDHTGLMLGDRHTRTLSILLLR